MLVKAWFFSQTSMAQAVKPAPVTARRGAAFLVAAGILLSRISGLIREGIFAHYFGTSDAADAFKQALKIPNFLQNLFGEGVLSASFIPVYAGLLARDTADSEEEAGRVAGAVFAILALVASILVLIGVLATPWLIYVIAPGYQGAKRDLTITLVRIFFPGAGLLVLSAWCLGILNSHRRFFLSYSVGVIWNIAMIAALVGFGPRTGENRLAELVAWASVAGSAAMFLTQLPVVLGLVPALRIQFATHIENVRIVIGNFGPVFVSRGVVQLSAFIDTIIASYLPTGAAMALSNAQTIYLLPVSLFGMSVTASELPEMSRAVGAGADFAANLRLRLVNGLRKIAFFVVPSVVAFIAFGDVIAGAIYQSGKFTHTDTVWVWGILRRLGRRASGIYAGASLFIGLLRIAGHANAAAVCCHPHCVDYCVGVSLCGSAAADARRRSEVGRRGIDRFGGPQRMDGIPPAAASFVPPHRLGGGRREVFDAVVGFGNCGCGLRLGDQRTHRRIASEGVGRGCAVSIRSALPGAR